VPAKADGRGTSAKHGAAASLMLCCHNVTARVAELRAPDLGGAAAVLAAGRPTIVRH
jgi:hypothetical protein